MHLNKAEWQVGQSRGISGRFQIWRDIGNLLESRNSVDEATWRHGHSGPITSWM